MFAMASTVKMSNLATRPLDLATSSWAALHEHHMAVGRQIAEVMQPVNAPESWPRPRTAFISGGWLNPERSD
jgi:hypothetical protein